MCRTWKTIQGVLFATPVLVWVWVGRMRTWKEE